MTKTIFYARVSTIDQNIDHQKTQAEAAGFAIDEVIADHGVSGISTKLADRTEGKRLYDKLRSGDVLVVRWVDRLGRNYADVTDTIRHFMRQGVIIRTVINNMTFDGATTDPIQMAVRDALIAFMAATSQAQVEAIKEAQAAGIEAALANDEKYKGRKPSYNRNQYNQLIDLLDKGISISQAASETGLTRQTIYRIKDEPAAAEKALAIWGL